MLFRRFPGHALAEALGPAGDAFLLGALDRQAVGFDVLGDHRPGADNRALADRHRGNQRGVRADERARADHRAVLAESVVIAGDRAGPDVGPRPDFRVADVGQVIDLGAFADLRLLQFDEVADLAALAEFGARSNPRERADARLGADHRPFDMAEGV